MYEVASLSEVLVGKLRPELFGAAFHADATLMRTLQAGLVNFSDSYHGLIKSVASSELGVLASSPALTALPPVEYLNQVELVVVTSEAEIDPDVQAARETAAEITAEPESTLGTLIAEFHPPLKILLDGARAAYASQHPDHIRHLATSLRELFTHVLHRLSPDEEIKAWSSSADDFDKGRPTRRARLRYICRTLDDQYGSFVHFDIAGALDFLQLFQKGTHEIAPTIVREQLTQLKTRMEGLIRFMLEIGRSTAE